MKPTDITFYTTLGTIQGLCWQGSALESAQSQDVAEKATVLALHGWLDNAATYVRLAPEMMPKLASRLPHMANSQFIAIDLPGHGHSEGLPQGGDYYIWETIGRITEVIQQLGGPVHIMGHSMGAGIALLVAATFPELVCSVVALDSSGPLSTPAEQAPTQLRKGIEDSLSRVRHGSRLTLYKDAQQALAARLRHDPGLTPECILPVIERNLIAVDGGVQWRTDPRLRHASKMRMTEDMVKAFFAKITSSVMVLRAKDSLLPLSFFESRIPYFPQVQFHQLPGHHHFHLDAKTVDRVAEQVIQFYQGVQ